MQNKVSPSHDRPWLKYYSQEAINAPLPECTIYEYLWENNREHLQSYKCDTPVVVVGALIF